MYQKADLPQTFCDTCRWAEMTPAQRLVTRVRNYFHTPTVAEIITDQARWMARVIGGGPPASPYERHRQRFEETGDEIELDRMLRHVQP